MSDNEIFYLGHLRCMHHLRHSSLVHVAWHRLAYLWFQDARVYETRWRAFADQISSNSALLQWEHIGFDQAAEINPAVQKFYQHAKVSKEEITLSLEACGLPAPAITPVRDYLRFRGILISLTFFLLLSPSALCAIVVGPPAVLPSASVTAALLPGLHRITFWIRSCS